MEKLTSNWRRFGPALAAVLLGICAYQFIPAADHSDAPILIGATRQDANLTDLHAFTVGRNLVLALSTNAAIPPSAKPNPLGVVAGDLAGFPNGRRVTDDVVTISLRAIAGLTFPLIDKNFTPDAAAGAVTDGLTDKDVTAPFLKHFPFLGVPYDGFNNPPAS